MPTSMEPSPLSTKWDSSLQQSHRDKRVVLKGKETWWQGMGLLPMVHQCPVWKPEEDRVSTTLHSCHIQVWKYFCMYFWLTFWITHSFFSLRPKFSYTSLSRQTWLGTDGDSDWVVHLSFDSFVFSYESEFLVCDWTCLLGEIGGNLGFFLGGSVLGFVDLIVGCWNHRKSKWLVHKMQRELTVWKCLFR